MSLLPWIAIGTAIGAGLMAGLLFAFSNFVMQALSQLAPAVAMQTMQRINVTILNPVFLVVFVGTGLLSAGLAVAAFLLPATSAQGWLLAGAALYLVGVGGVTAAFNVPLNNVLARSSVDDAPEVWPRFVDRWTSWNHVRSVLAVAALACLAVGILKLGQS